jgi:hypothetical protein
MKCIIISFFSSVTAAGINALQGMLDYYKMIYAMQLERGENSEVGFCYMIAITSF